MTRRVCVAGTPPAAGAIHTPAPSGAPCLDGDACNGDEACDGAGTCAAGRLPALDDGDPCTLDTCDLATGISRTSCSTLNPTVTTVLMNATAFLYSGPNPLQSGVAPGTIEAHRAAVIRGDVRTPEGAPLAGIRISVDAHPEYGSTIPLLGQEPRLVRRRCHIHGFPLRLGDRTHRLPPFAMCTAFPCSDYYGGSAPRPRPHRTRRLATLRDTRRSDRGSHVQRSNPWCCRWSALPLVARASFRFGVRKGRAHDGRT